MPNLTTARLELVPMELDRDLGELHAIFSDPAVLPFSVSKISVEPADTRRRIDEEFGGNGGRTG